MDNLLNSDATTAAILLGMWILCYGILNYLICFSFARNLFFFFFSGGWAHSLQAQLARVLISGNELLYYPGDQA